ncbi:protein BatD [Pseudoalteromonas sp. SR44-5]|uniref:BatD family protein n=1 Tax=Pseudoalteromonas rhizosphaerae TaxID=2518973 RepID=A0ABW8KUS8_9GAMM|nr:MULTISPECIES: BatD family protein [unclassified Pseudoalteromonas]MBB1334500.1 protein BatD [Pseudoalteromonas sp. SR41-6]MBB1367400.1 protein BatD [Pseudoalteromonas sp. SR44-5]MBB1422743.1 protein BatD [Pseudoalteromonas sp. SG43-7]MBB1458466.1 protein BatD [Pseudoalteromonas sp. SG41-8]MBB1468028.1 protein BatD [Pseudoalteromonas sp. SG41-5]
MVMRLICCLLLISAMPSWAVTQLQASVDKNPVLAGEFFMLNISADDTIKNDQPDTSVLLKDFVVGRTSVSTRTNIINGSISKETTWSIKLMTRTAGDYTIPAFSVAGASSAPIALKVAERSKDAQQNNDIFIKASLSSDSLFVQEAGLYTVKLYLAKELLDGNLSAPAMPDAQLSQIGKQTENYELVDGKRYLVITREYLVQPQKSGSYTIQAPTFQGRIRQDYRQLDVSALGDNVDIEIKPIPSDYQGAWLPSELVNLDEQWQPADDTVEVGTPITRTLTLTALGITKEQLPDIELPEIKGIRSYPDEKENNHLVRDGRVISQQTASYALLPQMPGTYTLPEVSVPWYNTKINRISYATLPARTITVTPSSTSTPAAVAAQPLTPSQSATTDAAAISYQATPINQYPLWLIIISVIGYLLWFITLILWWRSQSQRSLMQAKPTVTHSDSSISLDELKKHAKSNDVSAFYQALNRYAMHLTKQSSGAIDKLEQLADNAQLSQHIAKLRAALYSPNDTDVDLIAIVGMLEEQRKVQKKSQQAVLKGLYK